MRALVLLGVVALAGSARADRTPVAVLWLGDAMTVDKGARTADELHAALGRSGSVRPIDGDDDRRLLVEGGAATRAARQQASGDRLFVELRCADATREYEAAERLLLEEVPLVVTTRRLAAVERNLLVCYDQLGRAADAARAAERLTWTAGTHEDAASLLAKYRPDRSWQPAYPPSKVVSDPPGVAVYRDLQPVGAAPIDVAGGDEAVDVVDLELPGFRRVHLPLGRVGAELRVTLMKEERLSALVDEARALQPDAPPGLVAQIGARVGAARVLVLLPDGPERVMARWLDVRRQRWASETHAEAATGQPAMDKLVAYVAPEMPKTVAAAALTAPAPAGPPAKSKWGAWGHWYTWVAAGGVVALVAGLLIAQHVGSDSLSVQVKH